MSMGVLTNLEIEGNFKNVFFNLAPKGSSKMAGKVDDPWAYVTVMKKFILSGRFHVIFLPELSWPERLGLAFDHGEADRSRTQQLSSSARPTINRPGSFKGQFSSNLDSIEITPHLFLGFGEFYVTVNFRSPGEIHQILVQTFISNLRTLYHRFGKKKLELCQIISRENWSSIFNFRD